MMGQFEGYDLPKKIVMISTADWDAPLWTNKQQIASRLACDFDVIYVEPLAAIGKSKRGLKHRLWKDKCGVTVFRPAGAVPFGNKLARINQVNCSLIVNGLREVMEKKGFSRPLLWCYPPTSAPFLDLIPHELSCYDCVDEYSAFPGTWATIVKRMEKQLVRNVDAVFTTARSLYEGKKKDNPHTYFVPNSADFEHFHQAAKVKPPRTMQELSKPVLGFVGALNYKIDLQLLEALFKLRPNWSFVFVGPDRGLKIESLIKYRNAHFLGRKEIKELPVLMAGFDLCMIPYLINSYTQGVLPLKFFEYLATGKPVISTPLPELKAFAPLVDLVSNPDQFVEAVESRMRKDPYRQRRIDLARKHSWEGRIGQILTHLEKVFQEKHEDLL